MRTGLGSLVLSLLWVGAAPPGGAEEPTPAPSPAAPAGSVTLSGYAEVFYSWNFNRPWNDVTAWRGFDNRHDTFTISNAALDVAFARGDVSGRVVGQVGQTPDTYYGFEPRVQGAGGAPDSGPDDWRFLQQAYVGWKPGGGRWSAEAGLFLSPIGPEALAVKDDWHWSRSTLYYALPYYHTGLRVTYAASPRLGLTAWLVNGWNNVSDNNSRKSVALQAAWGGSERVTAGLTYFGGAERAADAVEGLPWRHLFDGHVTWGASPHLSLQAHADAGFEQTRFGRSSWWGGALAARLQVTPKLYLAARADHLAETPGEDGDGQAGLIFFPARRVSSVTATLELRPAENLSLRLEYRHDAASEPIYYDDQALAYRPPDPFPGTRKSQDTLTFGATAWF